MIFPNEILVIILESIDDTQTHKNARLVCKLWYNILKYGKIFKNRKLINYIEYNKDYINYLNVNKMLVAEVKFQNYGFYEYKKFDNNYSLSIKSKPFILESVKRKKNYFEKITYKMLDDKKEIINYSIPMCNVM